MKQLKKGGVIEIIVITALLALTYTLVQASMVPFWDKDVEAKHIDVVYSDMMSLSSNIEAAAQYGTPKSSIVRLGVQYPNRILFFNPAPGAEGSITVEEVGITGSYTASGVSTHPINYNSSRIVYDLNGMVHSPKLVYEHGIIIWDWGAEGNVTADTQSLINVDTGNVHIPVVNAKPGTTSGLATKIFEIYPYDTTSDSAGVEFVTITLDTDYPDVWQDLLSDYIKAGLVSVSNQTKTITICSSALPYIALPAQPAQEAEVSAGVITLSKEVPPGAVLTIPAAISWNATAGKNVTATQTSTPSLTVTRTPAPTLIGRVFGGGGGGGGGGSGFVIIKEAPKVSTENATNISAVSATLNMAFDFNDYDSVQVQFKYKEGEELEWDRTGWVSRTGSGSQCYSETIVNLSANTTYYFLALLLYDTTEIEGVEKSFVTLAPVSVPTPTPTSASAPAPAPATTSAPTATSAPAPAPATTLVPTSPPTLVPTSAPTLMPTSPPIPKPTVKPSQTPRSRPVPSIAPRPTIRLKPRPML